MSSPAHACTCGCIRVRPTVAYLWAESVFEGHVVTGTGAGAHGVVTFQVDRMWKGSHRERILLHQYDVCMDPFNWPAAAGGAPRGHYFVYAQRLGDRLVAEECAGETQALTRAVGTEYLTVGPVRAPVGWVVAWMAKILLAALLLLATLVVRRRGLRNLLSGAHQTPSRRSLVRLALAMPVGLVLLTALLYVVAGRAFGDWLFCAA